MIYVSTGGAPQRSAAETALDFKNHGISAVELSGGAYHDTQREDLVRLCRDISFQVHNYFPPPPVPFVFNLASTNRDVVCRSIEHARSSMYLALTLGRPVYSFHAGFRVDPIFTELGGGFERTNLAERATALHIFGEALLVLADEAQREGISLLVENNVLSPENLQIFGEDPLLMTEPDEIVAFMSDMPLNVGLLLDLGHLKVTAQTLDFDLVSAHTLLKPWVRGYHLSDNNATADSNQGLTEDSWFWEVIDPNLDYFSLEVHGLPAAELMLQSELASAKIAHQISCMELNS